MESARFADIFKESMNNEVLRGSQGGDALWPKPMTQGKNNQILSIDEQLVARVNRDNKKEYWQASHKAYIESLLLHVLSRQNLVPKMVGTIRNELVQPFVPRVNEFGEFDPNPYSDYILGTISEKMIPFHNYLLSEYTQRNHNVQRQLADSMLTALCYMGSFGIFYADFRPSNALVSTSNQFYFTDVDPDWIVLPNNDILSSVSEILGSHDKATICSTVCCIFSALMTFFFYQYLFRRELIVEYNDNLKPFMRRVRNVLIKSNVPLYAFLSSPVIQATNIFNFTKIMVKAFLPISMEAYLELLKDLPYDSGKPVSFNRENCDSLPLKCTSRESGVLENLDGNINACANEYMHSKKYNVSMNYPNTRTARAGSPAMPEGPRLIDIYSKFGEQVWQRKSSMDSSAHARPRSPSPRPLMSPISSAARSSGRQAS